MSGTLTTQQLAALKAAPMFSRLEDGPLAKLLSSCRVVSISAGQFVFRADKPAGRFYVVLSGRVKIFKLSARGDEQILHLYGAGETFGEAAMWGGGSYPAHATVVADATLLEVSRRTLRDALAESPELAMGMLAGLSGKLQEFARLIEQLSLKEVPARLAATLLEMSERQGNRTIHLKQTKRQLASQLGTVSETLSRALNKLRVADLIRVDGKQITLVDPDGLRDIAEAG